MAMAALLHPSSSLHCRLNLNDPSSSSSLLPSSYSSSLLSYGTDVDASIFSRKLVRFKVRWPGRGKQRIFTRRRVCAVAADQSLYRKMNLNEYMVTLERPLGIRFALSVDGRIFVHSLKKGASPSLFSFFFKKIKKITIFFFSISKCFLFYCLSRGMRRSRE